MHMLITGGTGFIGSRLVAELLAAGHSLTIYSRHPETVGARFGPHCRGIAELTPAALVQPVDAVINLAGEPIADQRWTPARKAELSASRVELTRRLVDLLARLPVRPAVLVSASAVGYYGSQQDNRVTETTPPHDEFTHRLCAAWEEEARRAESLGVRVAITRTGLVVGKGGGFLARLLPPFRLGLGGRLGDGRQFMPWIHLDDLLRIFLKLLEEPSCRGVYNAVSPAPVSNEDFTRILGAVLHRPTLCTVPAFALKAALGELAQLLLTGQQAFPARLQDELGFTCLYPDLRTALEAVLR